MKNRLLSIFVIVTFASPFVWFDQVYASCIAENEINWNSVMSESEFVFTGTVTRLDNYDGPQRVTFFIHDVSKGEITTQKYVLENSELIFLENDTIMSSSINVDYKIGKTYKVYVTDGHTNQCTTKLTIPPSDYVWEPGPEDGNYYSANPVYENPCKDGYGLFDGVCITLEEINKDQDGFGLSTPEPEPEPEYDILENKNCGVGTTLQDGICVVNSENTSSEVDIKWGGPYPEALPAPDLSSTLDYDFEFTYVIVLITVGIIVSIVGIIFFATKRKTK